MFNAGPLKLGNILGKSKAVGAKNKRRFMEAYKPYALLIKQLEAELERNKGYIIAIDGRRLFVRHKKDVLNTYTQGNSAIIFKHWMILIAEIRRDFSVRVEQIIAYHDETQNEIYTKDVLLAEAFGKLCEEAAIVIGKRFNLNVALAAEAKVGKNWAECH